MFLSLKTLYRKRTVIWPFYFYTIIRTLSKQKNFYSEAKLEKIYDEYEFYHKYAVITTTTGYRYHKYDCYHLNNDNGFYIFNIENAAHQGYTPCLDCLGSGSTEEIKDKLERDLY